MPSERLNLSPSPCSYDYQVDPQGPEQKFLDVVRNAKAHTWV